MSGSPVDASSRPLALIATEPSAQASWLAHRQPLVITDLQMPHLGGVALAAWLRDQPGGEQVQVVGTSADLGESDAARAAGMTRLLQKPLSPSLIDEVVREARRISPVHHPVHRHGRGPQLRRNRIRGDSAKTRWWHGR